MIEKKFIESKKQEFEIKEFIKRKLGKGKIADVKIERTPVGEKVVISTSRPGLVIGRGGEIIQEINEILKKKFKLENPQIDVLEITEPIFNAQIVADSIAMALERFGPLRFKLIAYRELGNISKAGALGAEIRLSGRLPSERAKSWRFSFGYLKKTGTISGVVEYAQSLAFTKPGVVGVKVSIVPKGTKIPDKIEIEEIDTKIIEEVEEIQEEAKEEKSKEEKIEKPKEKKEEKKKIKSKRKKIKSKSKKSEK